MLGFDGRSARAAWTVLAIALGVAVVYLIRRTLLIFIFAMLLAYMLSPLVDLVDRYAARRVSRNVSLAAVYLALLAVIAFSLFTVSSRIAEEAASLASRLPQYVKDPSAFTRLPLPDWAEPYRQGAIDALRQRMEEGAGQVVPAIGRASRIAIEVFGNLLFVILVPILSFVFLKDSREIRAAILEQFSGPTRATVDDVLADVNVMLAQFMRALVLLSLFTFVTYASWFAITGAPYALLMAGVAGALEFIPVAGPLTAAIATLVVAGFAGYDGLLWLVVFFIVFRLFQDYVVQPYLLGSGLKLSPVAVIFGVLAGEQIGGVAGMFLSIPVLATLRVVYTRIRKRRLSR
jgi:predicted PurR-regulated permease PerM